MCHVQFGYHPTGEDNGRLFEENDQIVDQTEFSYLQTESGVDQSSVPFGITRFLLMIRDETISKIMEGRD
jgi:hypothetical protein